MQKKLLISREVALCQDLRFHAHTHMLNLTLETNDAKLYTCSSVDCSSDSSLQMESILEFYAHSPSVPLKLSILHRGNRDKQLAG